jgi:hypothetical protein
MNRENGHRITTIEQLRAIYGEPIPRVGLKVLKELDHNVVEFIARSPFIVLATADADGNLDASPKGDGPGFVAVEDSHTLLIPDRKGNRLLFGLANILANPNVAIIFMIPGTEETLRVNGVAELTSDPTVLSRLQARGLPALSAIRVTVHECFFHCAKAFIRSQLWDTEARGEPYRVSFGRFFAEKFGGGEQTEREIDSAVAKDYKENL